MKNEKDGNIWVNLLKRFTRGQIIGGLFVIGFIVLLLWTFGYLSFDSYIGLSEREELRISPSQIQSIEDIGEWEFLSIDNEELVDTVRYGFLNDDKLVRIYYGKLRIGLNMHELKRGWCTVNGDTLVAELPDVKLLDNHFIDEARTRSFYEEGKWSHRDREKLYQKAERQMLKRCLTKKNLDEARSNARQQMEQLFHAMGFANVQIVFKEE